MNREVSPLRKADDAIEVDTSDMTIEERLKFFTSFLLVFILGFLKGVVIKF